MKHADADITTYRNTDYYKQDVHKQNKKQGGDLLNEHDDDFDYDIDDFEYDISDYDMDDDEVAGFDAFIEFLSQMKEEYFSEPRVRLINPKRLREFQYALYKITKIIKKVSPDATIEHTVNDGLNTGVGAITIETDEIDVKDIKEFVESVRFATNFEIHPLLNGNLSMSIAFYGMLDEIKTNPE